MITDQGKRTVDEIKQDYAKICSEAGDLGYIIQEHKAMLEQRHEKMLQLKHEFQEAEMRAKQEPPHDETLPFNKQIAP